MTFPTYIGAHLVGTLVFRMNHFPEHIPLTVVADASQNFAGFHETLPSSREELQQLLAI